MDYRVISIGTLSAHPFWGERGPVRTGHATTTLIRCGKRTILVDPGLPEPAVVARLSERTGLRPDAVTHVFLTRFDPDTRRGISAFPGATWWIAESEREGTGVPLALQLRRAADEGDPELTRSLEQAVGVLKRCEPAPDRLATDSGSTVDLFPLPGVSPGATGLIIAEPRHTTVVCGDAAPTIEHVERGQVLGGAVDVAQARQSLAEAVEIADFLVLGRDNIVANPLRRPV
jgi:glyoxylase-like metal-dependent hydrolase (beta-lactamase superfamily II)